ncbi:tripartite tricarboxylate transporter substrate binding protein [Bordetella sp. BOR01]|uniref:tripartite tricarboxylate transporter substrate binding protein n=1 Tax=Bordetella sp. BOR01 TaxID=2854779 RepID=UPI001C483CBF|nr:tripartite tricarboxylate transporter substrate binding protein [Bordetella sp. BOR01]MBV7484567.1 tripartite tricarboxylate transporter substrate binding protein [Bordetella sp. BOR01]
MQRRTFLANGLALALAGHGAAARAAGYPARPIALVIGYTAGGLTDVMSRAIAERMAAGLRQSVIVENRPGAAASIAAAKVMEAPPDGYTLLLGTASLAINPSLQPDLAPRDPGKDLLPVGTAYFSPFVLLVRDDLPAANLQEFITYAKSNPGKINVASSGNGSVNHLLLEMFNRRANVDLAHIPYKGASQALVDLRGGRISATFATPTDALPVMRAGAGRILAVTSAERIALLPDVPAVAETLPGFHGVFWQALFAPVGTPQAVVDKLAAALRATTEDTALRARVQEQGITLQPGGPDQLRKQLAEETAMWRQLITDAHITIN